MFIVITNPVSSHVLARAAHFVKIPMTKKTVVDKLKEKEKILNHQSKMASMGEMIGNIAHQWRQPLNALSALNVSLSMKYKLTLPFVLFFFHEKSDEIWDCLFRFMLICSFVLYPIIEYLDVGYVPFSRFISKEEVKMKDEWIRRLFLIMKLLFLILE